MKKYLLTLICALTSSVWSGMAASPAPHNRIEELLAQMTIEEKLGQLSQLSEATPAARELISRGLLGSIINVVDPAVVDSLQRLAVEQSRLKIPLLFGRDVIHGYKTIFPIPLGQAATFNADLVASGARAAAIEASGDGIRWTFSPMVDISQDPRWGRMAESFGEDPLLSSDMGVAMIRGYQGTSLSDQGSIAACVKHFAGYGASEGGRDYNSTFISERRLRNLYLRPFEAAIQAGAATIMTAFNDNDGIPCSGNSFLLKEVLRGEWGFEGIVVSDWESVSEMITHGFCVSPAEAATKALRAGVDVEMVSRTYARHGAQLAAEGKISMKSIDDAVRRVLQLKLQLGLFDRPYRQHTAPAYSPEALGAAREMAQQSTVLLKNNQATLPLSPQIKRLLVVGPMAHAPHDQLGTWVFDGEKSAAQTPLEALKQRCGSQTQLIYLPVCTDTRDHIAAGLAQALCEAKQADAILAFVGEEAILSGEAHCLADISLQGAQRRMLEELAKCGTPLVTIVLAGRPLAIARELELSSALLYSFHPGTMGGPALVDLLFGDVAPSGKLPVTFPLVTGQIPIYYNHNRTGRPADGSEVMLRDLKREAPQSSLGNRSYYLDAGKDPLLPFGFGLSYATFEYGTPHLANDQLLPCDTLVVCIPLNNRSEVAGTEVVQVYASDRAASVTRPVRELIAYRRIDMAARSQCVVEFRIPVNKLAFWNAAMACSVEPGEFDLYVGGDSQTQNQTHFVVRDATTTKP